MDQDTKRMMGKVLGEVYRLQRRQSIACPADEGDVYGLLNGFERVIDEQLERIGWVSNEDLSAVEATLDKYWSDAEALKNFSGFYQIERELQAAGIDRSMAIRCFDFLWADGRFTEILEKMNSSGSPVECKTFELSEWEK